MKLEKRCPRCGDRLLYAGMYIHPITKRECRFFICPTCKIKYLYPVPKK